MEILQTIRVDNLVDGLNHQARSRPDKAVYHFLNDGEQVSATIGFRQLRQRALQLAHHMGGARLGGHNIALLFPPGLAYNTAVAACLTAGATVVPTYPPAPERLEATLEPLLNILQDARIETAVTTTLLRPLLQKLGAMYPALARIRWVYIEECPFDTEADPPALPSPSGNDLAFILYTSGSTGDPKGVMLSHHNMVHNLTILVEGVGATSDTVLASWLPPYHISGLMAGVLAPLFCGMTAYLMSPLRFLEAPLRWLWLISKYGVGVCGAPNFAYDLVLREASKAASLADLNLSSWHSAICGGEPINAETLERFSATFAACGFRPETFWTMYGLTEGTMVSSGSHPHEIVKHCRFSAAQISRNRVAAPENEDDALTLPASGSPLPDIGMIVVDPQSLNSCEPNQIGEIWISGPSNAKGYWGREALTRETFAAYMADTGEGPFLRSGDMGFIFDGEIYITGRLKEMIIIRGVKYYPQDLEASVRTCHEAVRNAPGAAFTFQNGPKEQLGLIQELAPEVGNVPFGEVLDTMTAALATKHGLFPGAIVLVASGIIPRTMTQKIRRTMAGKLLLAGELPTLAARLPGQTLQKTEITDPPSSGMEQLIADIICRTLGLEQIGVDRSLFEVGADSVKIVEIQTRLQEALDSPVELKTLFISPNIRKLAAVLERDAGQAAADVAAGRDRASERRASRHRRRGE